MIIFIPLNVPFGVPLAEIWMLWMRRVRFSSVDCFCFAMLYLSNFFRRSRPYAFFPDPSMYSVYSVCTSPEYSVNPGVGNNIFSWHKERKKSVSTEDRNICYYFNGTIM